MVNDIIDNYYREREIYMFRGCCCSWVIACLIIGNVHLTHKVLGILDPLVFPFLLLEVFEFKAWVKN